MGRYHKRTAKGGKKTHTRTVFTEAARQTKWIDRQYPTDTEAHIYTTTPEGTESSSKTNGPQPDGQSYRQVKSLDSTTATHSNGEQQQHTTVLRTITGYASEAQYFCFDATPTA